MFVLSSDALHTWGSLVSLRKKSTGNLLTNGQISEAISVQIWIYIFVGLIFRVCNKTRISRFSWESHLGNNHLNFSLRKDNLNAILCLVPGLLWVKYSKCHMAKLQNAFLCNLPPLPKLLISQILKIKSLERTDFLRSLCVDIFSLI